LMPCSIISLMPWEDNMENLENFICPECKGDNLQFRAWVSKDGVLVDYIDEKGAWCDDCEGHVEYHITELHKLEGR